MKSRNKFSRRLEKRRGKLLEAYSERELHRLRITLRRMRSLLKQHPGKKARKLRRDLGVLADSTNSARDWDTLMFEARAFLPKQQYALLRRVLDPYQHEAHETVFRMLRSPAWSSTIERWDDYISRHPSAKRDSVAVTREGLAKVLKRVRLARKKALKSDREKHWHSLRISIKDLRYRLDEVPAKQRNPLESDQFELCKQLQEELGDWHDTVAHRKLLLEFAAREWVAEQPQAGEVLNRLCETLETLGHERLQHVGATLEKKQTLRILVPTADRV